MKIVMFLWLFAMPALTQGETVYKSVGPDGRITYSQDPPSAGKVEKTLSFTNLPSTPLPESVLRYREQLEKSMGKRLDDSAKPRAGGPAVLFMAQWCGYCKQAKRYLSEKAIPYQEYDIDTPVGMRAFVELGAGKGVPVMLWNNRKVQGFTRAAYDALFSASR